jgi:hypothetical protein
MIGISSTTSKGTRACELCNAVITACGSSLSMQATNGQDIGEEKMDEMLAQTNKERKKVPKDGACMVCCIIRLLGCLLPCLV